MKSPTEEEFEESIKELSEYKNRLEKEVVTISQKLKMPQRKIESIINSHQELNKIKIILSKLYKQKENATSNLLLLFYFCCLNNIKMYPMNVAKLNSIKCI
jgi:exonuclease VII small subunit